MEIKSINLKRFLPVFWFLLAILSVVTDYYTGQEYSFPILITIPIALSTWYNGRITGIIIGLFIMAGELYLISLWHDSFSSLIILIYITVRLLLMFSFIILIDIISRQKKEIKILRGFLPICSFCKRIRDDSDKWIEIESYIDAHSEAKFSHSLCPDCAKKHYGEFMKE